MPTLIDGKATATQIKAEIAQQVEALVAAGHKRPHLAAILVGNDGGSETYVRNKVLACEACGFESTLIRFEDTVSEAELLSKIDELNHDARIDGFIVQLPLPRHIDRQKVIESIDHRKDVDGFHPINVGRLAIGLPCFISATPLGILTLLRRYGITTAGRKCVVVGRSNIVGKPMVQLMLQKEHGNATVTCVHSHTKTSPANAARPTSSSPPSAAPATSRPIWSSPAPPSSMSAPPACPMPPAPPASASRAMSILRT